MRQVSIHTFSGWCPTLDDALDELPEHPNWSHQLFRSLVDAYRRAALRIALWTFRDLPIGIIAFTAADTLWEPVTHWIVPGLVGPMRSEWTGEILRSVPLSAELGWWRMTEPLPATGGRIYEVEREVTYSLSCSENFENFWRSTGILKEIRRAHRRCAALKYAFNAPGATEWVIRRSEEHWRQGQSHQVEARVLAAAQLQTEGKLFCASLADGDRFVGGSLVLEHDGDGVGYMTFRDRDPRYLKQGIGAFLMQKIFELSKERGLANVDIGGSYDYKRKWARETSFKSTLMVGPLLRQLWHSSPLRVRNLVHIAPLRALLR